MKPHKIVKCEPINEGRQLRLAFADDTSFEFHTSWLRDSSPSLVGKDFYRKSAADVWGLGKFQISEAKTAAGGEELSVEYSCDMKESFDAKWLHSFAPHVGKPLGCQSEVAPIVGTSSMYAALRKKRTGWYNDVHVPKFDADELKGSIELQLEFLESLEQPGVAMITGVGTPKSLEREEAGKPAVELFLEILGKMNQHPVRSTQFGVMRATALSAEQGADYNMQNPLSMHTDHSVYHGTPGYIQTLYQAEGSVTTKVCDGLALAEHVRTHHPRAFELLSTVHMTHSSRNILYTRDGAPRNVHTSEKDAFEEGRPFELIHTHPVIVLDENGDVDKVVQSETKRGVCAMPYDVYPEWLEAYDLWVRLCEDERFIRYVPWPEGSIVVTNNYRTMHGRPMIPPNMPRTMSFGYFNRVLVENRYRLLKQLQAQKATDIDTKWLTRIPNQVLERVVS